MTSPRRPWRMSHDKKGAIVVLLAWAWPSRCPKLAAMQQIDQGCPGKSLAGVARKPWSIRFRGAHGGAALLVVSIMLIFLSTGCLGGEANPQRGVRFVADDVAPKTRLVNVRHDVRPTQRERGS
eukprot:4745521-Amphidinium_carterae.1